jgi:hypothetical protein
MYLPEGKVSLEDGTILKVHALPVDAASKRLAYRWVEVMICLSESTKSGIYVEVLEVLS